MQNQHHAFMLQHQQQQQPPQQPRPAPGAPQTAVQSGQGPGQQPGQAFQIPQHQPILAPPRPPGGFTGVQQQPSQQHLQQVLANNPQMQAQWSQQLYAWGVRTFICVEGKVWGSQQASARLAGHRPAASGAAPATAAEAGPAVSDGQLHTARAAAKHGGWHATSTAACHARCFSHMHGALHGKKNPRCDTVALQECIF